MKTGVCDPQAPVTFRMFGVVGLRTKMLRAIAVAMMLLMVFVNVPCLAEENTDMVPITPTYLNGADIDADTWA